MRNAGMTILMVVIVAAPVWAENGEAAWFEPGAGAVYNAAIEGYQVSPDTTLTINIVANFAVEAMDVGAITVDNTDASLANQGVDEVGVLNTRLTYRNPNSAGEYKDGTKNNIVIFQVGGGNSLDDPATPDIDEGASVPAGEVLYSFEITAGETDTTISVNDLIGPGKGPDDVNPYGVYPLATMFTFGTSSREFDIEQLQLFVVSQAACPCPGDLNADQQIDLEDLQAVAQILLQVGSPFILPVEPGHCGDLNADLQIDLEDLQAVATLLLEAGPPFIAVCE